MTQRRAAGAKVRAPDERRARTRRKTETAAPSPVAAGAPAVVPAAPAQGVVEALEKGEVVVRVSAERWRCQVLRTHEGPPLVLAIGDSVLITALGPARGCVLGRVEAYDPSAPAELHLRATRSLTVSCGESTLELSAAGKVAVRGVDVVSSAKRKNRIKGGSVEIN